jgi:hypothetical protein
MCTTKQKEENVQISMHVSVMPSGRYRQCRVCTTLGNLTRNKCEYYNGAKLFFIGKSF